MIYVTVMYKNKYSDKTAVKDAEVASKYVAAIISVFKHNRIIDDIEKIETFDIDTKEQKQVYPKVS